MSHDRYLINKLADKVYVLGPWGAALYHGNYDYYLERREAMEALEEKKAQPKVNLYKQRKERDAELRKKKAALARLEKEIDQADARRQELEARLLDPEVSADYQAVTEASAELSALSEQTDRLLAQWTELSEALEG